MKFDMHKGGQQEYLKGNSKNAYVEGGVFPVNTILDCNLIWRFLFLALSNR